MVAASGNGFVYDSAIEEMELAKKGLDERYAITIEKEISELKFIRKAIDNAVELNVLAGNFCGRKGVTAGQLIEQIGKLKRGM